MPCSRAIAEIWLATSASRLVRLYISDFTLRSRTTGVVPRTTSGWPGCDHATRLSCSRASRPRRTIQSSMTSHDRRSVTIPERPCSVCDHRAGGRTGAVQPAVASDHHAGRVRRAAGRRAEPAAARTRQLRRLPRPTSRGRTRVGLARFKHSAPAPEDRAGALCRMSNSRRKFVRRRPDIERAIPAVTYLAVDGELESVRSRR
jgi:hypothetical protein